MPWVHGPSGRLSPAGREFQVCGADRPARQIINPRADRRSRRITRAEGHAAGWNEFVAAHCIDGVDRRFGNAGVHDRDVVGCAVAVMLR